MNEESEDNLIQMGFRRYLTVIFLLLLLLAGAAVGAMAALAYTLFWGSAVKINRDFLAPDRWKIEGKQCSVGHGSYSPSCRIGARAAAVTATAA